MLQHSGAYTIDADQLAHQAMMPGAPAYKPVVETFGRFIIGDDGRINRSLLGKIVFSNETALKKLEAITHPVVRQAVNALVKRSKQRVIVIEAIKLLEGDLKDQVDAIWVVNASRKTQYKRLVGKRGMSENDAKQRIMAQSSQKTKLEQADVIIENDGDVEKTWQQVQHHWTELRKELSGKTAEATKKQPKDTASTDAQTAPAEAKKEPATAAAEESAEMATEAKTVDISGVTVKRGMPGDAQEIADFINTHGDGDDISRMDVMMSFGQKSYLLATSDSDGIISLLGWTVENLVTRMDEFYLEDGTPVKSVVQAIVVAVEDASQELQSEVGFIFLPVRTREDIVKAFRENGYDPVTLAEIKIPAWREAVEEVTRGKELQVLWKQLREDRVLQPI
jgi:dephospho-CoA kinase